MGSPTPSPPSDAGAWAFSPPQSPSGTPPLSPSGTPPLSPSCPSVGSDWQAVEAATRVREVSAQSSQTWLTADQAKELQSHSDVTVFIVKYVDRRDRPPDLLGAVKLTFDNLIQFGGEGRRAHTCVMMLGTHMTFRSAHVLRCRESPTAKPVYYIFEDYERVISDRAQFAESYLMNEDRKFTLLRWQRCQSIWTGMKSTLHILVDERSTAMCSDWGRALVFLRPLFPLAVAGHPLASYPGGGVEHPGRALTSPHGASILLPFPQASSALTVRVEAAEAFENHTQEARSAVIWQHLGRVSMPIVAIWAMLKTLRWHLSQCPFIQDLVVELCYFLLEHSSDVVVNGSTLSSPLDKPRFAARWAQLRRNLMLHRVAQTAYLTLVFAFVVFAAAGGSSRLTRGGWRMMACLFASNSPVAAVRFNRILRFFLLLCGILWVASKLVVDMPVHGAMPSTRFAWGAAPCTSWESQQSSRQWEPGWEANVAEHDAHPHDLTGYKGKAVHNTFSIPFKDESKAVYQKPRKYSPGEQEIIDIHCKELLEYGFIEPAAKHCKHASNVVVAGKKDHETGLWTQTRFCVDLRGINRHSLKDNTLPHRPEELYQKVAKARFKTTLDATKAFHQIPMATEEDRSKTAFWWKNQLYQYTSMPFGAAGATSAFVRIMDYELRHLQHCTVAYVDDVVVYTDSTPEQHLKDVEEVLRTLGDAGIRLHAGKSTFGAATVDFLGYRIGHNSIGAQEAKCKAIQDLPRPQDKTGLRSILGMMNYYKGLVVGEPGGPNYSEVARPLNDLLKKEITDIKGAWGKEQDQALQDLILRTRSVLGDV
ncbi:hypothetical protein CYMTET_37464 [Cymbomonas tetramitiformis]|uniref:Reverse transcriptase domain-containing protein n=1 Tax=Cymbomonas tetramitiformis TaxID=36881 RepID=A0AAE0CF82_9CHLO|nr:hypothetical protein CYMTET_37464 [Cymbomonas tetramitiformis]